MLYDKVIIQREGDVDSRGFLEVITYYDYWVK